MMDVWTKCTVGDVCSTVSETYRRKSPKVILINTSDVLKGKVLNHNYVDNVNLKGQFKKTFQKYDILFSEIRPANERYAFIDFDDTQDYIASTKLMVIRPMKEKILPLYLYFILKSKNMLSELQSLAETRSGTFPQITFDSELSSMPIMLPNMDIQEKIITILKSIDNKIATNTAINNNLESQAQAIFKSWFVDFEPFGGEMPIKWKNIPLGKIADISSGKRPLNKSEVINEQENIPIIGASNIMGFTNIANHVDKILVIGRVGTHGIVQRFNSPCWTSDNTLVITSEYYEYVYQILSGIDYTVLNRGSTQPLITQGDMKKISVLLPDKSTLEKYEQLAGTLMLQHEHNIIENTRLAALRDTLLPRLMSGEIDVSNIKL